jgi:hypothetical protein
VALKTNVPGGFKIFDETFTANEDLSSSQNRVVVAAGTVTAGKTKVGLPSGQGVYFMGVLLNAPASGAQAEVRLLGEVKIEASTTVTAGVEVTITDATGKISTAGSGDYVVGIAKEAAAEAGHKISVMMVGPYQKN